MESDSHVDSNREEPNPFAQSFVQSFKSNERKLVQPHRRWQCAIVDEGEHIRFKRSHLAPNK